MTTIQLVAKTQRITVEPHAQRIKVDPVTSQVVSVVSGVSSVSVVNAGPPGPAGIPGLSGDTDTAQLLQEVDTKIATHTQAEVVHTNATSGRDFVALFENGLI